VDKVGDSAIKYLLNMSLSSAAMFHIRVQNVIHRSGDGSAPVDRSRRCLSGTFHLVGSGV